MDRQSRRLHEFIQFLKKGGQSSLDPFDDHYFDLKKHLTEKNQEETDLAAAAIATAQCGKEISLNRQGGNDGRWKNDSRTIERTNDGCE